MIGGDFNCSLDTEVRIAGYGVLSGTQVDQVKQDRTLFMDALRDNQLSALNTWTKKLETYTHSRGGSQIDFVLVRQHSADALAKQTLPVKTILAGWRSSGHAPKIASIPLCWQPWKLGLRSQELRVKLGFCSDTGLLPMYQHRLEHQEPRPKPTLPALESSDGSTLSLWVLIRGG